MSLINDAIKQANKANKERTPAPPAGATGGMQAADGRSHQPSGGSMTSMLLIAGIVVFVLLGGAFLFLSMRGSHALNEPTSGQPVPSTTTPQAPDNSVASEPVASPDATPKVNPAVDALNNPLPPSFAPKPSPGQADSTVTQTSPTPAVPDNPLATATTPAAPRPFPELKLQGIYYRLNNPSVMINGQTLEIGDIVEGARVIKIERKDVTLELDGQTKVLRLQ